MSNTFDSDLIVTDSDNLVSIIGDIFRSLHFKLFVLLFIVFIFLNSDVFINRILAQFAGTVTVQTIGSQTTSWGSVVQASVFIVTGILLDALIQQKIL